MHITETTILKGFHTNKNNKVTKTHKPFSHIKLTISIDTETNKIYLSASDTPKPLKQNPIFKEPVSQPQIAKLEKTLIRIIKHIERTHKPVKLPTFNKKLREIAHWYNTNSHPTREGEAPAEPLHQQTGAPTINLLTNKLN